MNPTVLTRVQLGLSRAIASPNGDIFFHHSVVADLKFDDLKEGQTVTFEVTTEPDARGRDKGPRATSVHVA